MELNRVYKEDCLIGMSRIPDKSVDMILCDLPYGTTACKWDVIIPFKPLWEQYERIIKDNGAIVLTASQPFTSALVMSNPKLFRYEWIWHKNQTSGFLNASVAPLKSHESILVFSLLSKIKFNPIKEKRSENTHSGGADIRKMSTVYGGLKKTKGTNKDSLSHPKSVKFIKCVHPHSDEKVQHPTQKPVALFEYLIKTYTNEGETVLDNCMGSGTTAIACINTNRNYIGFEKEEKYYQIIQDRIKNHTPQLKLIA